VSFPGAAGGRAGVSPQRASFCRKFAAVSR